MSSDATSGAAPRFPIAARPGGRRARTDTVLQLEAAECGAASLAMVLSHFGRRVSLEELRIACGVSRDGSTASAILRAARAYGLDAKGLKAEPEHLRGLEPPMIAFVNFDHFLVVEGIRGSKVFLNDPASGPRKVSMEEFDAMFTGVVLTFSRTESFERGDSRPSVARQLRDRLRGYESAIFFVFLASLALVVPGILVPVMSRVFVDHILIERFDDWLLPLLIGMALTAVVRGFLTELQTQQLLRAETRLATEGSQSLLWRMLRLPVQFFSHRYAGEIANRLDLNDDLAKILTGDLSKAALSLLSMVVFFLLMLAYNTKLALVVAALTCVNVVALAWVSRRLADGWRKISLERGKVHATAVSGLQDIESFKAAGAEDTFFGRWAGQFANLVNAEQRLGVPMLLLTATPVLIQALSTGAVLVIGGFEIMSGAMTLGMLVAFQSLMASFSAPVTTLTQVGAEIQQLHAFTARLNDIQQQPVDKRFQDARSSLRPDRLPSGDVRLDRVAFGYAPLEPPLIEALDLAIAPGSRIALVGPSGSGKSTTGRIVAGLYEPWEGEITVDGRPLADWPPAAIAARLGYVDQDIVLFEGSVRENLCLWDTTLPEKDMIAAARDAQIHDFIMSRPGGYDSRIEEAGRNMSGGQRQRLDLARALARNPSIIVLDEATSALDPATELAVMEALRQRGVSCVIVAHRLSAIRDCDEIIVLEHGKVVERGQHEELISQGGIYARLIET